MNVMQMQRIADLREETHPLVPAEIPAPRPGDREVLIRVSACGVCHTDLDEIEGRTAPPNLPVVPGHQVVGRIEETGPLVSALSVGRRVGVAWIYSACGVCRFCRDGYENLCPEFRATGRDVDGGYAPWIVAREDFVHPIPDQFSDVEAAPLLCAGAIGYRSLRLSGIRDGEALGLTGFGASAHLVLKLVRHLYPRTAVYVFARGESEKAFARELGAVWTGNAGDDAPAKLRAVIDTTPAWNPVVEALKNLEPGGRLVVNAIRKEDADRQALLRLDYPSHLWMEKEIKSVANVTRRDVREFLDIAAAISLKPEVEEFPLARANEALVQLKNRIIKGAKVLRIG
ncbi:MAG TPA: zinc-dependent alcohol dehydrogenase family protein [Bacteroidota bacterium]|nr:zinc-dependent alcohol dehydrogenase family protein [Bacteroidota bacterium]